MRLASACQLRPQPQPLQRDRLALTPPQPYLLLPDWPGPWLRSVRLDRGGHARPRALRAPVPRGLRAGARWQGEPAHAGRLGARLCLLLALAPAGHRGCDSVAAALRQRG
eukprot:4373892-Prymnesium_polylepis.1